MAEQITNRASPGAGAMCDVPEPNQTEQLKTTARETKEELRRKSAEMLHETKDTARQLKDDAVQSAAEVARQAQNQAAGYADAQKGRVAAELRTFGEAISRAADKLREEQDVRVAGYADMAADQLTSAAEYLRMRDISSLMRDVETFARRRPEVFFGATFLIGMGLARFLKASSRGRHFREDDLEAEYGLAYDSESAELAASRGGSRQAGARAASQSQDLNRSEDRAWSPPDQSSNLSGMNDPLSYH